MTDGLQLAAVSVVVVSYNTKQLLAECLASIFQSVETTQVEIVVVDNNSTDGSVEAIHTQFPGVTVIANQSNLGFGTACNQAIRATRAPLILLLNSDAKLTAKGFSALHDCVLTNYQCGAAGCRILDLQAHETVNTRSYLNSLNQALELAGIAKWLPWRKLRRTHQPQSEADVDCSVDWIDASCLMLRRVALDEIGLFDERFFMYSEDEDLCYRLRQRGWSICFTGAGEVIHRGGASAEQKPAEMLKEFYSSQVKFLAKHRGPASVMGYVLSMKTVLLLKQFYWTMRRDRTRVRDLGDRRRALKLAAGSADK